MLLRSGGACKNSLEERIEKIIFINRCTGVHHFVLNFPRNFSSFDNCFVILKTKIYDPFDQYSIKCF